MENIKLKNLSPNLKITLFFFIAMLLLAYLVAVLQVYEHTGFSMDQVSLDYLGSEDPDLMAFPKPYREMLQVTHVHIFTIPIVYFLLGVIFLGTTTSDRLKRILLICLYTGMLFELGSLWLLRYVSIGFAFLGVLGQALAGTSYLIMCFTSLRDILTPPSKH